MRSTTFNVKLAREIIAWIKAHPETWDQELYVNRRASCGTAYCFAGHAVLMTQGDVFIDESLVDTAKRDYSSVFLDRLSKTLRDDLLEDPDVLVSVFAIDGEMMSVVEVHETAMFLLGLTDEQADELFQGSNTLADLEAYIDEYEAELLNVAAVSAVQK